MSAWDDHDTELRALVKLAERDLQVMWRTAPNLSTRTAATAWLEEAYTALVATYGEQAAWSAIRALENTRASAGLLTRLPRPQAAGLPGGDQIAETLHWALGPLESGIPAAALDRLSRALGRLVLQPARQTVWNSTARAGTRYARKPEPGACKFCLMLASRGAVYVRSTVTSTTGARGKRPEGLRFHDSCHCQAVESHSDDDLPADVKRLQADWERVTNPSMTTSERLDAWAAALADGTVKPV